MWLHAEHSGVGPPMVLVHGFAQTGRCWGPLAADLARDHAVVLIDAPGHGGSADVRTGLQEGAQLIGERGGEATYLGYSMGGRFLVHLALSSPDLVRGLVLVGATAGIDDPDERAERARADAVTAARLRELGLRRFLDEWVSQPLFAGVPPAHRFLDERLENTVEGLEQSLLQAGTGQQEPAWDRLHRLDMPVLVVAGADDAKYTALGRRLRSCIGDNATFVAIDDSGHSPHLEQPAAFIRELRTWMTAHAL